MKFVPVTDSLCCLVPLNVFGLEGCTLVRANLPEHSDHAPLPDVVRGMWKTYYFSVAGARLSTKLNYISPPLDEGLRLGVFLPIHIRFLRRWSKVAKAVRSIDNREVQLRLHNEGWALVRWNEGLPEGDPRDIANTVMAQLNAHAKSVRDRKGVLPLSGNLYQI